MASLRKVPLASAICFGIGGIPVGLFILGLAYFAIAYYSNALGISSSVIGLALMLALVSDAITDPLVGAISDRTRSRWGRRHPYMYAAALPTGLLFYLFWNPPAWALASNTHAFCFVLGTAVSLRLAATFFEVPSNALMPELTRDYDGRSDLMNYKMNMYYGSTSIAFVLIYHYFLIDTPEYTEGILRVPGYQAMGLAGGIAISLTMLVSAAGLHRHIPSLPQARPETPRLNLARLISPFRNRSLRALFVSWLFWSVVHGTVGGLFLYVMTYFWGLTSDQLTTYALVAVIGTPIAFLLAPFVFRGREKKRVAIAVFIADLCVVAGPVVLRLFNLMPENGTTLLLGIIYAQGVAIIVNITILQVALASMLAEVVEAHAVQTGEQVAGLISSARTFALKVTMGVGAAVAGLLLDIIDFPTETALAQVPAQAIFKLGAVYGPVVAVFGGIAIAVLFRYRISRRDHERNLAELGLERGGS